MATTTTLVGLQPETNVWHRFAIELKRSGPGGATFSATRDGVAARSIALPITALPLTMTTLGVTLGPSNLNAGESWMSWQDNVVIEVL